MSATQHWYVYLMGSKFVIKSNHNPLKNHNPQKKKDPYGKIAHWIAELECFDFTVEHISGTKKQKADALSRNKGSTEYSIPGDWISEQLYAIDMCNPSFAEQLRMEQEWNNTRLCLEGTIEKCIKTIAY